MTSNKAIYTKGCPPILIKDNSIRVLVILGIILPILLLLLILSKSENKVMPNSQAILFIIPFCISSVLLSFTGIIQKIVYAIPILTLTIVFWPLGLMALIMKITDKEFDVKNSALFSTILWTIDLIFSWFPLFISLLLLISGIIALTKG